jgi:ribosomal protein L37AE/L43A
MTSSKKTVVSPNSEQLPVEIDQIRCPVCKKIQEARILDGNYLHNCTRCGYLIKKDEWNSIKQ